MIEKLYFNLKHVNRTVLFFINYNVDLTKNKYNSMHVHILLQ